MNSQVTQRRLAHTDVRIPDFDFYRKESVKNAQSKSRQSAPGRQSVEYAVVAGELRNMYLEKYCQ